MMSKYKISKENETWYTSGDGEIFDKVTNPKHYKGINGLEVIEVHKNFLTEEELRGYYKGNTLKYLLRERKKNGIEDLKKARKHLDWLIELEEN
jgi:hypothetical protein